MMAGAAHDPKFAKKVGIPVKVAKEFNEADAGSGIRQRYQGSGKQTGNAKSRTGKTRSWTGA